MIGKTTRPLVALTFLTMAIALVPTLLNSLSVLWQESFGVGIALWVVLGVSFAAWQWTLTSALIAFTKPLISSIRGFFAKFWH